MSLHIACDLLSGFQRWSFEDDIISDTVNTLARHIFSCLHACLTVSHVTLAQGVVRVIPSMFHALVCMIPLRLSTLHS